MVNSIGIIRYDGKSWQSIQDTVADKAITGIGPSAIWAAGNFGTVSAYDGESWAEIDPAPTDDTLTTAVAISSGPGATLWVFGATGSILVKHFEDIGR